MGKQRLLRPFARRALQLSRRHSVLQGRSQAMDGLGGSSGTGRRVRPRVLLLLALAWLAMLLPALVAIQKHLACGQDGCGQQGAAPEPLVRRDTPASRSAMEVAAAGGSGGGMGNSSVNMSSSSSGGISNGTSLAPLHQVG